MEMESGRERFGSCSHFSTEGRYRVFTEFLPSFYRVFFTEFRGGAAAQVPRRCGGRDGRRRNKTKNQNEAPSFGFLCFFCVFFLPSCREVNERTTADKRTHKREKPTANQRPSDEILITRGQKERERERNETKASDKKKEKETETAKQGHADETTT